MKLVIEIYNILPEVIKQMVDVSLISMIVAFLLVCLVTQAFKKVLNGYGIKRKEVPLILNILLSFNIGGGLTYLYLSSTSTELSLVKLIVFFIYSVLLVISLAIVFYSYFWKWIFLLCDLVTLYLKNLLNEAKIKYDKLLENVQNIVKNIVRKEVDRGRDE